MEYLKRFDAATSHCSLPQTVESSDQPLGKQHVKAALQALGVTARFLKCGDSFEEKDGLIVKSIALVIRDRKQAEAPKRVRYAVAVLAVDRSIDMSALGVLMTADPADISLADKQTLVRVFGYSRGCLGPIGLRKQQATRVIVDACLKSESYLLCGAGATDEVYAITPSTLIGAVEDEDCPTYCARDRWPVCGSDGKIYDNDCLLEVAQCKDPTIEKTKMKNCI
ncbi:hypothetical protein PHYBOEH_004911 [Phytophthora boehmeriae]|uniref:Kazal-like domain-containing protein n=1 Tax=Phytophthora boehmeriae TaxID=109152 RepID=A0A8T1X5P4_9STRA|nr:hypothetical protein PHYBOEH_004911 [Phytophthora boehmeriae]